MGQKIYMGSKTHRYYKTYKTETEDIRIVDCIFIARKRAMSWLNVEFLDTVTDL